MNTCSPTLLPALGAPLADGIYAGCLTQPDGALYALILLPHVPAQSLTWQAAMDWAESLQASLPTRPEAALLFALLRSEFEQAWHWTNETVAWNAASAWTCSFLYGGQYDRPKSYEGCARAVRRFPLQSFNPSREAAAVAEAA